MYVCNPDYDETRLADYDISLRASSAHFRRSRSRVDNGQTAGKQPKPVDKPICCEARVERIKLHSGYYPNTTPLYIPPCTRTSNARCLIVLGEEKPPSRISTSRCSSRVSYGGLPVFQLDSDAESFDPDVVTFHDRRNVGLSTSQQDQITIEPMRMTRQTPKRTETEESGDEETSKIVEMSMAIIMSSTGTKMPRPVEDFEALWRRSSDKEISNGRSKATILFPEEELMLDKYNILPHMGQSIYSMSKKLKDMLETPQDYRFLSRFVQLLHIERKTANLEAESGYGNLPLGDHFEKTAEHSPAPHRHPKRMITPTRPNCIACTTREMSAPPKEDDIDKLISDSLKVRPKTPQKTRKSMRKSRSPMPVEAFARTQSPAVTWVRNHPSSSKKLTVKDENDKPGFKNTMCG